MLHVCDWLANKGEAMTSFLTRIAELEEKARKATQGQWQILPEGCIHKTGEWEHQGNVPPESIICIALGWNEIGNPEPRLQIEPNNSQFIISANPTTILELCSALRKATEALQSYSWCCNCNSENRACDANHREAKECLKEIECQE